MLQILKKKQQLNSVMFGGNFFANKPVFHGKESTKPFSSLFYWSHSYVTGDSEFGLHPHEGFEIMTFILEGANEHYDSATRQWIPLYQGDFQIIQSNRGISHSERIKQGSRAFQIWFNPDFQEVLNLPPSYTDYKAEDFLPVTEGNIEIIYYAGEKSKAQTITPDISIKKYILKDADNTIKLNPDYAYMFYVIEGEGLADQSEIEKDDAFKITDAEKIKLNFKGELFCIEVPKDTGYPTVWQS